MRGSVVNLTQARHQPDWASWQQLTRVAPPFLAPEFFALANAFEPVAKTLVAEAWDEERMIGALPLVRERDRLSALRCDYTPEYDYYGTPEGVDEIWRALLDDPSWNELVLDKLPVDSVLATRLPTLAGIAGCPVTLRLGARHPYFALQSFAHRMPPKFRANLERCVRKAGGVELERIAIPTRAEFDEAMAIEAMAWKGAAGTSIDTDVRATHFYRAWSKLLGRRGQGALYFLRCDGRRIATLLAVEDGTTLYALKIGYDPSVANLSPGHLLVWHVAAEAEARGLQVFDFVGRDDEWKRKWTDLVHELVSLIIYRNSAVGLARYAVRAVIRPRLPDTLRDSMRSPLPRGCQRSDLIGVHTLSKRIRARVARGLGVRSAIKNAIASPRRHARLGEPSVFAAGTWVRVKSAEQVRATLDHDDRARGLSFTPAQWQTAGQVFRVEKSVRRLRDDKGKLRPVWRTVVVEHLDCSSIDSGSKGCGRHCPMMFRDEWLEPAPAPKRGPTVAVASRHARVRELGEIMAGLDLHGRRDGLTFMPEMRAFVAKRFTLVSEITKVFECDEWSPTRGPIYVLDGLHCTGAVLGTKGPCDRACALLWHGDWLVIDPPGSPS